VIRYVGFWFTPKASPAPKALVGGQRKTQRDDSRPISEGRHPQNQQPLHNDFLQATSRLPLFQTTHQFTTGNGPPRSHREHGDCTECFSKNNV